MTTANEKAVAVVAHRTALNSAYDAEFSAKDTQQVKRVLIDNPREIRLLETLLAGEASREALDRKVGASNSPDIIFRLRQRGFDLPCEMVKATDRDGFPCRFGVYSLSAADRIRASREAR